MQTDSTYSTQILPSINEEGAPFVEPTKRKKIKEPKRIKETSVNEDHFLPSIQKQNWIRNIDESNNIYYYDSETGATTWLGPCSVCALASDKWCIECELSFCNSHFDKKHSKGTSMADHTISATECLVKEALQDDDEAYCIRCTTKTADQMCTTCWDPYCRNCFKSTHNVGYLKSHKVVDYAQAKRGWICIRATCKEQTDFYTDGNSGTSTFDKPFELMTDLEAYYYKGFKRYQDAVETYINRLEELQFELESVKYERDCMIAEAQGYVPPGGPSKTAKKNGGAKGKNKEAPSETNSVLENAIINNRNGRGITERGLMALVSKDNIEYRNMLLHPSSRRRGQTRTDYIKSLLDDPVK